MKTATGKIILDLLKKHKKIRPHELSKYLKISRQAVHKQLRKLTEEGKIIKYGLPPHVCYCLFPQKKKRNPHYLWDYDYDELKKTEEGRIKILERMINYGPEKGEKIPLDLVKKYWDRLDLYNKNRRLMELLIWGKYRTLRPNKPIFSIK